MPMSEGAVFAGFTIVRSLGSGEMGEAYLARHPRLPRQEELTILAAAVSVDPDFRRRFEHEAGIAAALSHPHISAVRDRGEQDGRLWITVDHINGTDAATLLHTDSPRGLPGEMVCDIVDAIADALDYAHTQDLLHRDVSPSHILLTESGSRRRRIMLTDFGIARSTGETSVTNTSTAALAYSSPEQLMGTTLDGRTDQYSLAATAYHLLTGSPPFAHTNSAVLINSHLNSPPPRLADTHPNLAALDAALSTAMAKDPAARYSTCSEFAQALTDAARGGHPQPPPPIAPTTTETDLPEPPTTFSDWGTPKPPPTPPAEESPPAALLEWRGEGAPAVASPPPEESPPPAFWQKHEPLFSFDRDASSNPPPMKENSSPFDRTAIIVVAALITVGVLAGIVVAISSDPDPPKTTTKMAPPVTITAPASAPPSWAAPSSAPPVCGDLAAMSTRDKLAQLLMVGVTGAADARAVVDTQHVGGIMIGSWTDLSMLSDGSMADIAAAVGPVSLAVSVDEEGGRVSRLSSVIGSQPAPRVLAQTSTPEEVYAIALDRGRQMRGMGITIDFAPVVDVTDAPASTVIGDRSFGSDPTTVTDYAGAYARGLRDAGLLPVLKHFPGHGHGSGDSRAGSVVTPRWPTCRSTTWCPTAR